MNVDDLASFKTFMSLKTFYLKHVKFETLHSDKSYYPEKKKQHFEIIILLHWRAKTKTKQNAEKPQQGIFTFQCRYALILPFFFNCIFYICLGICQQKWPHKQFRYVSSVRFNYIERKYRSVVLHISFLN